VVERLDDGIYRCNFCKKGYTQVLMAESCEKSHKILYVPATREDIAKLVQFIFTKEDKILPEKLVQTLMLFASKKENLIQHDLSDMQETDNDGRPTPNAHLGQTTNEPLRS
jgi:hypothetical protein